MVKNKFKKLLSITFIFIGLFSFVFALKATTNENFNLAKNNINQNYSMDSKAPHGLHPWIIPEGFWFDQESKTDTSINFSIVVAENYNEKEYKDHLILNILNKTTNEYEVHVATLIQENLSEPNNVDSIRGEYIYQINDLEKNNEYYVESFILPSFRTDADAEYKAVLPLSMLYLKDPQKTFDTFPEESSGLEGWAIALIVIAVIIILVLIIALVLRYFIFGKKNDDDNEFNVKNYIKEYDL